MNTNKKNLHTISSNFSQQVEDYTHRTSGQESERKFDTSRSFQENNSARENQRDESLNLRNNNSPAETSSKNDACGTSDTKAVRSQSASAHAEDDVSIKPSRKTAARKTAGKKKAARKATEKKKTRAE